MKRNAQHGGVPWFLMFAIVSSIGIGVVAWQVLHKRAIAEAAERARAPKPVPKPVEPPRERTPEVAEPPVAEEPAAPPPVAEQQSGACDEVACVIAKYEPPCCARFKRPASNSAGDLQEGLERAMISKGIADVKQRIMACGDGSTATGKVTSVDLDVSPDPDLGACVVAAVKKATFPKTVNGGSFSYPFIF